MLTLFFILLVFVSIGIEELHRKAKFKANSNYVPVPILLEGPTGADLRRTYNHKPTKYQERTMEFFLRGRDPVPASERKTPKKPRSERITPKYPR
jgi:hypothetical protein